MWSLCGLVTWLCGHTPGVLSCHLLTWGLVTRVGQGAVVKAEELDSNLPVLNPTLDLSS